MGIDWNSVLEIVLKVIGYVIAALVTTLASILFAKLKTKIKEAKGLIGTLESLKKLADEMLEHRLNDKDYFKKSLEFEIELIEKHPERFENPQLELLLLKTSLIRIKNAR